MSKPRFCETEVHYTSIPLTPSRIGCMDEISDETGTLAVIAIRPSITDKQKLYTAVHEAVHVTFPGLDENEVLIAEEMIADVVWKAGFRKIKKKKV